MIEPINLSNLSSDKAKETFNHWLIDEPFTLVVILGDDQISNLALETANRMINSGTLEYKSVRAVYAPTPDHIVPTLKQLKVNPDINKINWDTINNYVILSISNKYNNIGEIVKRTDYSLYPGGYINRLVRWAEAFDKYLN